MKSEVNYARRIGVIGGIIVKTCLLISMLVIFVFCARLNASDQTGIPKIESTKNGPVLTLPQTLNDFIKSQFPGFRVPGPKDMVGGWAQYKSKKDVVPYACWGDFNKDGLSDVATILLSSETWKLVTFHNLPGGSYHAYEPDVFSSIGKYYIKVHAPQNFYVYTVKAGQKTIVKGKESWVYTMSKYDRIAFLFVYGPLRGALVYWFPPATDSKWEEYRKFGFYSTTHHNWGD